MAEPIVRPPTPADREALLRLMDAYIVDFYHWPRPPRDRLEALVDLLAEGRDGAQLVAEVDGELVGFATLYFTWSTLRAQRISILNDLYAFVATALAGLIVLVSGFDRADPIASLVVAALMLRSGILLLVKSGRVFLEAAPEGVDPEAIGRDLAAQPGVVEVHDLHVWEVTSGFAALSAHVVVKPDDDCHARRRELARRVQERFGIEHTTLQVDHETRGGLLEIEPAPAAHTIE